MQSRPIRGLRGERVYLRPLEAGDIELVHHWYEDVRVAALMGDPPISLAARKVRYEESVKAADPDVFRFIICLLVDDRRIGRTDLFDLDRQNGSCALGITLGEPESWGHGLGTDAVNALVDFAFGQLRMERVWLDTDAHNERAQAAYAKAGFTQEGRFRHAFYQDGRWTDDLRMALLREEWEALTRPRSWDLIARAEQA
ncbi:MAG: GNAT family N-acetyltransferase [Actinomycetota bacterium]|nr:GNAT family N-acetyltransferase [Actinomycetota bacterium]